MEFATMVQELTMINDFWRKILRQKARYYKQNENQYYSIDTL
jgi:hypothetical protein